MKPSSELVSLWIVVAVLAQGTEPRWLWAFVAWFYVVCNVLGAIFSRRDPEP